MARLLLNHSHHFDKSMTFSFIWSRSIARLVTGNYYFMTMQPTNVPKYQTSTAKYPYKWMGAQKPNAHDECWLLTAHKHKYLLIFSCFGIVPKTLRQTNRFGLSWIACIASVQYPLFLVFLFDLCIHARINISHRCLDFRFKWQKVYSPLNYVRTNNNDDYPLRNPHE